MVQVYFVTVNGIISNLFCLVFYKAPGSQGLIDHLHAWPQGDPEGQGPAMVS